MSASLKIITSGHVITMDDDFGDLQQGAVLLEGNRIAAVAENADAFDSLDAERIDAHA